MSWCTGPLVISPVRDHTPPGNVAHWRAPRRPRTPLSRDAARAGRPARWPQDPPPWPSGVLRPVTYCPPGRPPCRPPPGNFADSRAGHPAGPGMAPAQGPCPGGVRIRGPAAPGGEASSPGPQVPLPRRYAAGTCGLRAMLPQSGPNRQQPALPAGAGGAPAACSAKAAVTTGRPAPAGCSPDRRPAAPPTGHDRPEQPPAVPAAGDVLPVQARGPGLAVPAGRAGIMDLHAQHPVPARI